MTDSEFWRRIWCDKVAVLGAGADVYSGRRGYTETQRLGLICDAARGLGLNAQDELLDVGCAAGFTGRDLRRLVRRYVGIDYSRGGLLAFGVPWLVRGNVTRLPFRDRVFSKAYMGSVFLCLSKQDCASALAELRRVTRERIYIADTLRGTPPPCKHPERNGCRCYAHVTWFTKPEFEEMAHYNGWTKVVFKNMDCSLPNASYSFDAVLS